jgi:hypothetical protein
MELSDHLLKPQVQGIVQIHIGEDGRDRAALRRTLLRWVKCLLLHVPGFQPLPKHPLVHWDMGEQPVVAYLIERPNTLIPLSTTHQQTTWRKSRLPTPAIRCTGAALRCSPRARAPTVWAISSSPTATPWCSGFPRRPPVWSCHRQSPNR